MHVWCAQGPWQPRYKVTEGWRGGTPRLRREASDGWMGGMSCGGPQRGMGGTYCGSLRGGPVEVPSGGPVEVPCAGEAPIAARGGGMFAACGPQGATRVVGGVSRMMMGQKRRGKVRAMRCVRHRVADTCARCARGGALLRGARWAKAHAARLGPRPMHGLPRGKHVAAHQCSGGGCGGAAGVARYHAHGHAT